MPTARIACAWLENDVRHTANRNGSGFLLKDAGPEELLRAIMLVAASESLLAPSVTRRLIAEFAARPDPQSPPAELAELTEREREILELVATGLSNADIAGRLVISPLTAKTHVARILAKLDCHDRAQLVALAYETGAAAEQSVQRLDVVAAEASSQPLVEGDHRFE